MDVKNRELLLKDLCARIPYGVICNTYFGDYKLIGIRDEELVRLDAPIYDEDDDLFYISEVKPYLRSLSSMTVEEEKEFKRLKQMAVTVVMPNGVSRFKPTYMVNLDDDGEGLNYLYEWFNSHHLDFRGLIPKGLALEAQEGMYGKI